MKLRLIIVEADEVSAGDVSEILERAMPGVAPAVVAAALPAAAAKPAARPPSVPTAIVPASPGWRPSSPTRGKAKAKGEAGGPQPSTPTIVQCRSCGGELPDGKDRRCSCPK